MKINGKKLADVCVNYHGWLLSDRGTHFEIGNGTNASVRVNNDGAGFYVGATGPILVVVEILKVIETCIEES
jgi:hypothetical protein